MIHVAIVIKWEDKLEKIVKENGKEYIRLNILLYLLVVVKLK